MFFGKQVDKHPRFLPKNFKSCVLRLIFPYSVTFAPISLLNYTNEIICHFVRPQRVSVLNSRALNGHFVAFNV